MFAAVIGGSSVIGPQIGEWSSRHRVSHINFPLGGHAMAGFLTSLQPIGRRVSHSINCWGAATLLMPLASLTLVTSLGGRTYAWDSAQTLGHAALALATGFASLLIERRAAEPIRTLGLFRTDIF